MHIAWLSGWGLPQAYTLRLVEKCFAECSHSVYAPRPSEMERLANAKVDCLVGYSLGAFLAAKEFPELNPLLLAPFHYFPDHCQEVIALKKKLQDKPLSTLNNFYKHIGIDLIITTLPYPLEDLLWGLEVLSTQRISKSACRGYVGSADVLLSTGLVQEHFKNTQVLKHTGHGLEELLPHVRF